MKFKVSAILPIPADVYFVERDSSAFRSLVAETCKLESLEMGDTWMEGETEVYEFVTTPDVFSYCPQHLKKFLPGGDLHYVDVIEYDPKCISKSPYKMHVKSIPPIFAHKAKIDSWLSIEEETEDTCRQTLEGVIEFKIVGLGHMVEKIVVDNLKNVYKGIPKIVERWVNFRNEVLKQPNGRDILVSGRPKNQGVDWITERITALIQAEDSASDISGPSSTSFNMEESLPTAEEMMERCAASTSSACTTSASNSDDDDEFFFDARENPSFMRLRVDQPEPQFQHQSSLDRHIQRDNLDARKLLHSLEGQSRRHMRVEMQATPASRATGTERARSGMLRGKSGRFSLEYNAELQEWRDFWKEQEVPESRHVKNGHFKKRLANVLGIGADAGLFKLGKSKSGKEHTSAEKSKSSKEHTSVEKSNSSKEHASAEKEEKTKQPIFQRVRKHMRKLSSGGASSAGGESSDGIL